MSATVGGSGIEEAKHPEGWVCMTCLEHFSEAGAALRHFCQKNPSYLRGRTDMREEIAAALEAEVERWLALRVTPPDDPTFSAWDAWVKQVYAQALCAHLRAGTLPPPPATAGERRESEDSKIHRRK